MFKADFINDQENKKYGKYLETLELDEILNLLPFRKDIVKKFDTQIKMLKKLSTFNNIAHKITKNFKGYIQDVNGNIGVLDECKLLFILIAIRKFTLKNDVQLDVIYHIYRELEINIEYKKLVLMIKNSITDMLNYVNKEVYDQLEYLLSGDFKTNFPNLPTKFDRLSNEEVLDTFCNGYYFHDQEPFLSQFEEWSKNPAILGSYQTILSNFLPYYNGFIQMLKLVNESIFRTYETKTFESNLSLPSDSIVKFEDIIG